MDKVISFLIDTIKAVTGIRSGQGVGDSCRGNRRIDCPCIRHYMGDPIPSRIGSMRKIKWRGKGKMIYLYSGTPGSGKSLHAVYDLYTRLRLGRNCIANFPINFDCQMGHKLRKDKFLYLPKEKITVKALLKESLRVTHKRGFHENNILFVVDEAELLWNSRMFQQRERMDWISFFSQHRHFGFNIILIAQKDRMIDRQIRALIEYDVEHRKAN